MFKWWSFCHLKILFIYKKFLPIFIWSLKSLLFKSFLVLFLIPLSPLPLYLRFMPFVIPVPLLQPLPSLAFWPSPPYSRLPMALFTGNLLNSMFFLNLMESYMEWQPCKSTLPCNVMLPIEFESSKTCIIPEEAFALCIPLTFFDLKYFSQGILEDFHMCRCQCSLESCSSLRQVFLQNWRVKFSS